MFFDDYKNECNFNVIEHFQKPHFAEPSVIVEYLHFTLGTHEYVLSTSFYKKRRNFVFSEELVDDEKFLYVGGSFREVKEMISKLEKENIS